MNDCMCMCEGMLMSCANAAHHSMHTRILAHARIGTGRCMHICPCTWVSSFSSTLIATCKLGYPCKFCYHLSGWDQAGHFLSVNVAVCICARQYVVCMWMLLHVAGWCIRVHACATLRICVFLTMFLYLNMYAWPCVHTCVHASTAV